MPQSDLLELAIGVVFVWFLLSTVISVVNEAMSLVFRIRAKHLWQGIGRLVEPARSRYSRKLWETLIRLPFGLRGWDPRPKATRDAADASIIDRWFHARPKGLAVELQGLYEAMAPMVTDVASAGRRSKLTQVSKEVFAGAVLRAAATGPLAVTAGRLRHAAEILEWSTVERAALATALGDADPDQPLGEENVTSFAVPGVPGERTQQLLAAAELDAVPAFFAGNPKLRAALERALTATGVEERFAAVRTTIETWFDREMEQLSALYRRQSRKVVAMLALPTVLIFQANVIGTIGTLRHDAGLRQALGNAAVAALDAGEVDKAIAAKCPAPTTTAPAGATATTAAAAGAAAASATAAGTTTTTAADPAATTTTSTTEADPFDAAVGKLRCAGQLVAAAGEFQLLPQNVEGGRPPKDDLTLGDLWHYAFTDWGWAGRAISLVALTFGAQFWYDVLRRLVGLRKSLTGVAATSG